MNKQKDQLEGLRKGYTRRGNSIEHNFFYKGVRYTVNGKTYEECELKKAQRIRSIDAGECLKGSYVKNEAITLNAYFKEWEKSREGFVRDSTKYADAVRWARIDKLIGTKKIRELEPRMMRKLQQDLLATGLSSSSVNDTMTLLRSVLKSAKIDKIIPDNPCYGLRAVKRIEPRATDTNHRALTKDEQIQAFKFLKNSWYYELLVFLLYSGCRVGEAAALTWDDIDYAERVIHITKTATRISGTKTVIGDPKTDSGKRDIPLTNAMADILQKQRMKRLSMTVINPKYSNLIFCGVRGDLVKHGNVTMSIHHMLKQGEKDTGVHIDDFSCHALRATFATRCIEQGMEAQVLKKILGHSKIAITLDLYAHVLMNTRQDAMDKISIVI